MTTNSYAYQLESIIIYKFGTLISGAPVVADKQSSLDITLQVLEINLFESIFSTVMRAELAVVDPIGLMVNFPLSGEEAVFIRYKNFKDDSTTTLYFIIDSVTDMSTAEDSRSMGYLINLVSIESYANAKQTIQQGYHDTMPNVAKQVFEEHIVANIKKVFPKYLPQPFFVENNDVDPYTVVIPNIHAFAALEMLGQMASESNERFTYLMFQTSAHYNFLTLQGLFDFSARGSQRDFATKYGYVYISDQIEDGQSKMNNDGRVITNMKVNKRLSSFQKIAMGYYHNNLFEINIAQKAVFGTPTRIDDIPTLYDNKLNTQNFTQLTFVEGNDEESNRTRYVITTQKENATDYPVSRQREKWGRDLIASNAMAQIDITVTIPGTSIFHAGDLFSIEIPEMHAFNNVKEDDLIAGLFLITEVKHILSMGGFHTTVLRLNRDSYKSTIDRPSRYV